MNAFHYFLRYTHEFISLRLISFYYPVSSVLLNIFFPVYKLIWNYLFKYNYFFVFELYPNSPGHISSDYQRSILVHLETHYHIILVGPYSILLDDFAQAFNRSKTKSGVFVFASSLLYFLLMPVSVFQSCFHQSTSLRLLKFCSSNLVLCASRYRLLFLSFLYFKIFHVSFNRIYFHQLNFLSMYSRNLKQFSAVSMAIKDIIAKLPFRSHLTKSTNIQYVPCSFKRTVVNATAQPLSRESVDFLLEHVRGLGLSPLLLDSPAHQSHAEPHASSNIFRKLFLQSKSIPFYDQIIAASSANLAMIHASGIENLFAIFRIPVIYFGSWHPDYYALNPFGIDLPACLYSNLLKRDMTFEEMINYRTLASNHFSASSSINVRNPSVYLIKYFVNLLANNNLSTLKKSICIYPSGRNIISRPLICWWKTDSLGTSDC